MFESRSNLLKVVIDLFALEGIKIIVFVIPAFAIFKPNSFLRSFSAV